MVALKKDKGKKTIAIAYEGEQKQNQRNQPALVSLPREEKRVGETSRTFAAGLFGADYSSDSSEKLNRFSYPNEP